MKKMKKPVVLWGLMSVLMSAYLGLKLIGEDQSIYLVGDTTHGHHQIEMACKVCHTEAFGGDDLLQKACLNCHGEEMKSVDDSHPRAKFTDPRNAERVANLDARLCVTCHREHRPEISGPMGVTLPQDFCFHCHSDIAKDRPSHQNLAFDTCASAGCHNFHDNRALYEDFLLKHADEPDLLPVPRVMARKRRPRVFPISDRPPLALNEQDADAGPEIRPDSQLMLEWLGTAHAKNGVNCSDCHRLKDEEGLLQAWQNTPSEANCKACHEGEMKGFLSGKHGMRLASSLKKMKPALAKAVMKNDVADKKIGCMSCHGAHAFDTQKAAVEACLSCHDDEHSRAYLGSPHGVLFKKEMGEADAASRGVSCATCHMPRFVHHEAGSERVRVQHNQNWNLRPNEKMIREVCLNCHGLRFSMDALADPSVLERNFSGRPDRGIPSIDWAKKRMIEKKKKEQEGGRRESSRAL